MRHVRRAGPDEARSSGSSRGPASGAGGTSRKARKPRTPEQRAEDPTIRRRRTASPKTPSTGTEPDEGELLRLFAESLDLLCIADMDGHFRYLNPAWTALLGRSLEELKARPFLDFVHPDDHESTRGEVGKLAEGADTILFENRYRHRDGSFRWLQWNARPAPGCQRIYAIARDISRQKQLEGEILEVVDRERERLGRELHDGLCQSLAGIVALSSTLSRTLAADSGTTASAMADEITGLLKESIQEARNLAHGLGPAALEEAGLHDALEELAQNVERQFRISCTLECERPFPQFRREAEAHLFRITQEAVNNAITHGKADRIELSLRSRDGQGLLSILGNGVSMPGEEPDEEGIGLRTMAYRAHLIGGSLEVRRRTPRGMAITCVFPLPRAPDAREKPGHV